MRTSYEVTLIARPCFGRHCLASYLSNGVHPLVVYQCFEAIVILFVALSICYLTLALGVHIDLTKLELCRGWKWEGISRLKSDTMSDLVGYSIMGQTSDSALKFLVITFRQHGS